ncbi:hypothetical protein BDW72DRAFT_204627 [Aspergillus terricola var. indicus]
MVIVTPTLKEPESKATAVPSPSPSQDVPPRRSFRSFIWDKDTHLKTPDERHLLLKLDIAMLSIGCLGFFMKYLDQGNLSNAYVSGMQEALSMYGNEYTYAQTMYTIAYAIMQILSTLIIQRVRPSIWLAAMEICWGAFTFAQAGLQSVPELYAFRFLVGFFKSSFSPSLLYLLGSWYTKTELAKRVALFHMTAPLGTAFGGWLYIICGCMTVPVGIATFFILPDTPEIAKERVTRAGKAAPVKVTLSTIKGILESWKRYAFVLGYVLYGSSCENLSVADRNIILTGTSLISAACVVLWGFLSDYTGSRFAFVLIPLVYGLLPNGILAFWPTSLALKEFAFLTIGVQLMTAVFYSWANEVCADNNEQRAVVISSMNGFQYAVAAWLPISIYVLMCTGYGFPATFGLVIAAIVSVIVIRLFIWPDERRAQQDAAGEEPVV